MEKKGRMMVVGCRWVLVWLLFLCVCMAEQDPEDGSVKIPDDVPTSELHLDCAKSLGEGASADAEGQCRCPEHHEVVGGKCVFGKRSWEALERKDMPTCSKAKACAKELTKLLQPGVELLESCLEAVHNSRASLQTLQEEAGKGAKQGEEFVVEIKDQAQNLRVQNQRLLVELEMLSGYGAETETLQRNMRKMVTENEMIRGEIADLKKKMQKGRAEISALEKNGVGVLQRFEENMARLQERYADNNLKVPLTAK